MTYPDNSPRTPEQTPTWQPLDVYVRRWIASADRSTETMDEVGVMTRMWSLNEQLRQEDVLDNKLRVRTKSPGFYEQVDTPSGTYDVPIVEPDLIGKNEYVGRFTSMVATQVEAVEDMSILHYRVELSHDNRTIIMYAPLHDSRADIAYEEDAPQEVYDAFTALNAVDDGEYSFMVEEFERAFWSIGEMTVEKARILSYLAIEMLESKVHKERTTLDAAVATIILNAFDDQFEYWIKGIAQHDGRDESGKPYSYFESMNHQHRMMPVDAVFVKDFEVIGLQGDMVDVSASDSRQPAIVFFDIQARQEVVMPLRYLTMVQENHTPPNPEKTQPPSRDARRYARKIGGVTCGRASYLYRLENLDEDAAPER